MELHDNYRAERLADLLRLEGGDRNLFVSAILNGRSHAEALAKVQEVFRPGRHITVGSEILVDGDEDYSEAEIKNFREEWADRAERVAREGGLLVARMGEAALKSDHVRSIVESLRKTRDRLMAEQPPDEIQLSAEEATEVKALGEPGDPALERYRALRFEGEAHNIALMLATKRGPTGIVRDTDHPTPNKGGE